LKVRGSNPRGGANFFMKTKQVSPDIWNSVILPNSGVSFSTVSPLNVINGPHFAFTWAGVSSYVSDPSVAMGTIYGSRYGFQEGARIKIDEWLIHGNNNDLLIQDVKEKSEIPDHHTEATPSMFLNAPIQIRELFKK